MQTLEELKEEARRYNSKKEYELAYELYLKMAQEYEDLEAYFFLGTYYQCGFFVEQDYKTAKNYYFLAAKQNDADSICNLGYLYEFGLGVKKNKKTAFIYYKKAHKLGNVQATYNLANCYFFGDGIEQNIKKALYYYEFAADNYFQTAFYQLGLIYEHGQGVEIDLVKAMDYYLTGASLEDNSCEYKVAILINDPKEAFYYMKRSSEHGNSIATSDLGCYYKNGYGVEKDIFEAYECFSKSAAQFEPLGMVNKAICLKKGQGVEQNMKEAFEIFKEAAYLGNEQAIFNLGLCYEYGEGVEQNISNARKCYKYLNDDESKLRIAFLDFKINNYKMSLPIFLQYSSVHPVACLYTAHSFYEGYGIEQDLEEAIYYYKKAIEFGEIFAYYNLGKCYRRLGMIDDAISYLKEGIKLNVIEAYLELASIYFSLNKKEEAFNLINDNANLDPLIKMQLAAYYFEGEVIEKDLKKAYELFDEVKDIVTDAYYYLAFYFTGEKRDELLKKTDLYGLVALLYDEKEKSIEYSIKAIKDDDYFGYIIYSLYYLNPKISNEDKETYKKIYDEENLDNVNMDETFNKFIYGIRKYYGILIKKNKKEALEIFNSVFENDNNLKKQVLKSKVLRKFSLTSRNK